MLLADCPDFPVHLMKLKCRSLPLLVTPTLLVSISDTYFYACITNETIGSTNSGSTR